MLDIDKRLDNFNRTMDRNDKIINTAGAGIGCFGCLLSIVYFIFYVAAFVFAGWTLLAWVGIVGSYPWQ